MANDSYTQTSLGRNENFQRRMRANLMSVAWEVMDEPDDTEFHDQRARFARQVVSNPDSFVASVSGWIVMRPNIIGFETSYNFSAEAVVTAAGDPDIQSQLMTDWNDLAGVIPETDTTPIP